jgi:hypothetical protein
MTGEIQLPDSVVGGLQIRTVEDLSRVAKMFSASGFFADAKDASQCGVKVLAGLEMGFGGFASMTGIHIIKGKPSVGAGLMASAVKRHPNYNYRVVEHTDTICRIEFFEKWDGKMVSAGTSEVTMKEIVDAKLHLEWDKQSSQWKEKHNWKAYPKNMLFARAMSNGVKWFCPDVFDAPVYTPDELGATVDSEGNYIEGSAITVSASPVEPIATPIAAPVSPTIQNPLAKEFWALMKSVHYEKDQCAWVLSTIGAIDSEGNPSTVNLTEYQYCKAQEVVGVREYSDSEYSDMNGFPGKI